jgi:predicted aconitase with swiveling domain
LKDTCPEVTPYNRDKYNHLLTNSLKAEHYLTSGLNNMPTSVSRIQECVAVAFDPNLIQGERPTLDQKSHSNAHTAKVLKSGEMQLSGYSLPSQTEWEIKGTAMVTDVPITYLGYVNRDSGIVEDPGHPLDGLAIEDSILIYPKGSGSTVAPYVLMGLIYTGKGPKAIINRDVCPLSMPAASLLGVPYATGFDDDPCMEINSGDQIRMKLDNGKVSLEIISRVDA